MSSFSARKAAGRPSRRTASTSHSPITYSAMYRRSSASLRGPGSHGIAAPRAAANVAATAGTSAPRRWRITSARLSPAAAAGTTNALRSLCRWLAAEHALPAAPAQLTRGLLERYLAHVHARDLSTGQKRRLLGNLRTFLNDVRDARVGARAARQRDLLRR